MSEIFEKNYSYLGMMGTFSLKLIAGERERLPISCKYLRYFEVFIREHVLEKHKIILYSQWNVDLLFILLPNGRYSKGIIEVLPPTSTGEGKVRFYPIKVPADMIINEADNKQMKIAEVFYEGITRFFTQNYKKVDEPLMKELWTKVDIDYLKSIPYPAHLKEIQYEGEY